MRLAFDVTDHYSNAPELIVAAARAIGKSELKLKVFCEVYRHKQRVKSVQEIADAIGLDRMQVLQAGGSLKKSGLFGQGKKDKDTAYSQNFTSTTRPRYFASLRTRARFPPSLRRGTMWRRRRQHRPSTF